VRRRHKIPRSQPHYLIDTFDRKPAVARNQRKAHETCASIKLEGPVPSRVDSTGHITAWLEEREHARERVSLETGRSRHS